MELSAQLLKTLDERSTDYHYTLLSFASFVAEGEVNFLRGRVEFIRSPVAEVESSVQIGPLLLERKIRPGAETVQILKDMLEYVRDNVKTTGRPWSSNFGGFRARPILSSLSEPGWLYHTRVGLPNAIGEPRFCAWPSVQVWAAPPSPDPSIDLAGPIVDYEAGIVTDPHQYLDEFFGANIRAWQGPHRGLWLVLPDYRARFSGVEIDGGSIRARFEPGTVSSGGVHFALNVDGHASSGLLLPLEGRTIVEAQLPRTASSVQLVAFDRHRKDPIDWVNLTSNPWYAAPEVRYTYSAAHIDWLVSGGESETLEFKEFPSEKAARKQHYDDLRRVVETAVAFSNTGGGIILVGVTDDGRGAGVDIKATRHSIEQSMRDSTAPSILVEFDQSELEGKPVLVVKVPRGPTPPYVSRASGAVHVRVGASNFRANPTEIRELVAKQCH